MKKMFFLLTFLIMSICTFAGTITSFQSGSWSNTSTWSSGKLPTTSDTVVIALTHIITIDVNTSIAGMTINGSLVFSPTNSVTLQSTQNIVVNGILQAKPNDYSITHLIQFVAINETKMVGGGMDPIATDVGLWVMGMGQLNLEGSYKKPFINSVGTISAGATSISLIDMPDGWKASDELVVTPTSSPSDSVKFDETTVKSITINSNGKSITLNKAIATTHPQVNGMWTAEVINLTRNVKIEGTSGGRTHIFIRSMMPQRVLNTQLRYIGPRKQQSGDATTEFLLGRYGFHFHHCMEGSVGSLIDGCVVRDAGSHAFVPHMSDGITMSHNIAYNVLETAFWWDFPDPTHNVKWIANIVANVSYYEGSIGIDGTGGKTLGTNGFILGIGDDNICDSNVVVAQYGLETTNSAYDWEETDKQSTWQFVGNIAHNCYSGIRSWQNNEKAHVIENTIIYNCSKYGVFHGAYGNNYTYNGGYLYNNIFEDHASSADAGVKILNMTLDGAGQQTYPLKLIGGPGNGLKPILLQNSTIKGGKLGSILDSTYDGKKSLDILQSNITGDIKFSPNSVSTEVIRIQPVTGQPTQVKKAGITNITTFAPTLWGTGHGLKAEYFNNVDFTAPAVTRTEPVIIFKEWTDINALPGDVTGVHHTITDDSYSVRFTGFIEPQFTEAYTFKVDFGGGVRLYVDNKLIINKWFEAYPNTYTSTAVSLTAGKKVPIRLEYFNNDNNTQLILWWTSKSRTLEVVPQSQLYVDTVSSNPIPNQPPVSNAGQDILINLPSNTTILNGILSSDADGSITTYKWEKISGPESFYITNPNQVSTSITNLVAGTYVFKLTVTDNNGATSTDNVTIQVNSANLAPSADAGQGQTINLVISLIGNGNDQDGTIVAYKWEKVSGPTCIIANPFAQNTTVNNLQIGTYVFKLTVTDNQGATGTASVTYIIQ